MTKPTVWIIIVNWNGKEDTVACLTSLRHVPYRPRHILLVDNASSDGSVEAVRSQFPEVEILQNDYNAGFAVANNLGIRKALAAGAEFVLLLNNDTEVAADFLDHLVLAALFRKEVGMVAPKIYYHHSPQLVWFAGGRINWWTGHVWHLGLRQLDHPSLATPEPMDYLTGCALLVRKECIEKIGMLDESYPMYAEDADWCVRARQAGFLCLFQPEARIWHKVSASSNTSSKVFNKVRSNYLLYKRHARWYHWPVIPFGVLAGAVIEITRQIFLNPKNALATATALTKGLGSLLLRPMRNRLQTVKH